MATYTPCPMGRRGPFHVLILAAILCVSGLTALGETPSDTGTAYISPRYIFLNIAAGAGPHGLYARRDYGRMMSDAVRAIAAQENPNLVVGLSFIFSTLERSQENLEANLRDILAASAETKVPVLVAFDGQNWWESRPELWNWWDPKRPGYDPRNAENVEWTGWDASQAVKIGWRNWGAQIRVAPAQNVFSPRVIEATQSPLRRLLPMVEAWRDGLPDSEKYLCAGVKLGWEAGIGYNAYFYADGNRIAETWPEDTSHDPTQSLDLQKGLSGGVAQIGYAAVKAAGIKSSGELTRDDIGQVIQRYLAGLARLAHEAGLPPDLVYVHQGGTYAPYEKHLPYTAAFNEWSTPGWSFYFVSPDAAGPLGEELDKAGRRRWAAAEWLWPGGNAKEWQDHIERTLRFRDCRFVCIYNWDQGGVSGDPGAIEGIRQVVADWRVNP